MQYQEACDYAGNCQYAIAVPVQSGPTREPLPEEVSIIMCRAPIKPGNIHISPYVRRYGDRPEVEIHFFPVGSECMLFPQPEENNCPRIATDLQRIREHPGYISARGYISVPESDRLSLELIREDPQIIFLQTT